MKLSPSLSFVAGLACGVAATVLAMRPHEDRTPSTQAAAKEAAPPTPAAPFSLPGGEDTGPAGISTDPFEELDELSGKWASGDGSVSATFDHRTLYFHETEGWPDLNGKTFLLGRELQFLSDAGIYSIGPEEDSPPNKIRIIKEDRASEDLMSFTLFREGDPRCRARPPFPNTPPPPEIQAILDAIPNIRPGQSADSLLRGLVLPHVPKATVITGMSSGGQSDDVWSLEDGWLLKLSEARGDGVVRFQIARGTAKPLEYLEYHYPYYVWKKVVTGVSASGLQEFRQVAP